MIPDHLRPHRKAVRHLQAEHSDGLEVKWLPPDAPDPNPVEMVWNHTRYANLAGFAPDDLSHLYQVTAALLETARGQPALLRSFFHRQRSIL